MVSLVTFNNKIFEDDDFIVIKNICYADINPMLYDTEKFSHEFKNKTHNNFKIISLLVTNNANITNISI